MYGYKYFNSLLLVQSKYVGTANADTTKEELLLTQHRDTYASILGHGNLVTYIAVAENQSISRTRLRMLEAMLAPTLRPLARSGTVCTDSMATK